MNAVAYVSVHLSLAVLHLYFRPFPSCIISASISFFFSFWKTLFGVFVLICVHACVSVTYNPSCLFFPDTSVRLSWQRASVWDGWIDGETERKRVENVSVIKLLPLPLSSKRAHLSLLVPPFPSAQLPNHFIPLFSSLFLSSLMYSSYFSLTHTSTVFSHLHHLTNRDKWTFIKTSCSVTLWSAW